MKLISPKKLAKAADVSESSIKRWCDQGEITSIKTAGGHRRVSLADAAEFLRRTKRNTFPEVLGLSARSESWNRSPDEVVKKFYKLVIDGNESACRKIVLDLHMSGESVSKTVDQLFAPVFRMIGEQWTCDHVAIYEERRACEICLRIAQELMSLIPVKNNGPIAIGATLSGDPYVIPNMFAEITLRQCGWRSQSLGTQLPFSTLAQAVNDLRPKLVWLSISSISDFSEFIAQYQQFYNQVYRKTAIVVGGRGLQESLRCQMQYAAYCDNMQHLESFAKSIHRGRKNGHDEK